MDRRSKKTLEPRFKIKESLEAVWIKLMEKDAESRNESPDAIKFLARACQEIISMGDSVILPNDAVIHQFAEAIHKAGYPSARVLARNHIVDLSLRYLADENL